MSSAVDILKNLTKTASTSVIQQLLLAKALSDARDYKGKHQRLRMLIEQHPEDFFIDSADTSGIVGLTHTKTGFRIHAPRKLLPITLRDESNAAANVS